MRDVPPARGVAQPGSDFRCPPCRISSRRMELDDLGLGLVPGTDTRSRRPPDYVARRARKDLRDSRRSPPESPRRPAIRHRGIRPDYRRTPGARLCVRRPVSVKERASLLYSMSMDRAAAWDLLCEFTKSDSLRRHALAVEACVVAYARKVGGDEKTWSLAALLHDFDWEIHPQLPDHPLKGEP